MYQKEIKLTSNKSLFITFWGLDEFHLFSITAYSISVLNFQFTIIDY